MSGKAEPALNAQSAAWKHYIDRCATGDQSAMATAWLVTLARSRAIDRLRSRSSRDRRELPILQFEEMRADSASPELVMDTAQRRQRIIAALAALSPEQREAIELAFFSGLTHSELAERLGQPLGTVKTRIRLGMMKLREQLEAYAR